MYILGIQIRKVVVVIFFYVCIILIMLIPYFSEVHLTLAWLVGSFKLFLSFLTEINWPFFFKFLVRANFLKTITYALETIRD